MRIADFAHGRFIVNRRVQILSSHLATLIAQDANVLDIGCGDGLIDRTLIRMRPDLSVHGIDVLVRDKADIQVEVFDGLQIPFGACSFDFAMLIDVLHHVENAFELLAEAVRVSNRGVLIKDHILEGLLAGPTLRFMDRLGNVRHGVSLPYEYWPRWRWLNVFQSLGVKVVYWKQRLGLYPWPANRIFERSMHFVARLDKVVLSERLRKNP